MFHFPSVISGLKIAWVKRYLNDYNKGKWKCFFRHYLENLGGNLIWFCNMNVKERKLDYIQNTFIKDIVKEWCKLTFTTEITNGNQVRMQCIWHNSLIKINDRLVFYKNWYSKVVTNVKDLLNGETFLDFVTFKEKYNIKCNFLEYYSLIHAIPSEWKKQLTANDCDCVSLYNLIYKKKSRFVNIYIQNWWIGYFSILNQNKNGQKF